ncbi:RNA polymerase sigma factor [Cytophaga sp. FL35]|uniref:RNA polymerase sigma factor n=1 Tax=Cytophaga sp. FL35 TaxID=1904456 RepID=UPI0016539011|nr:RNA polymerase sigma factor [Cytophaga sp. FL35]MBC6998584.1 RNA polymerase sigma factor [Cytophaga sp. FL35]
MKIIPFYTNEKQLIRKSISGNRKAQKALYQKHSPLMLGICRRYVKDMQFAEDVMVSGFVKVFKFLPEYRFDGSFEGWMRRIMVNESISFLRKKQFVVFDDTMITESAEIHQEHSAEEVAYIQNLIDGLPDGYRAVFMLYAVEGYKHQEISSMLDISESTSKSQLFKARKWLQERLRNHRKIGYEQE